MGVNVFVDTGGVNASVGFVVLAVMMYVAFVVLDVLVVIFDDLVIVAVWSVFVLGISVSVLGVPVASDGFKDGLDTGLLLVMLLSDKSFRFACLAVTRRGLTCAVIAAFLMASGFLAVIGRNDGFNWVNDFFGSDKEGFSFGFGLVVLLVVWVMSFMPVKLFVACG